MTILPKKKASKDKNDSDKSEHSVGHSHPHSHGHSHAHNHPHYHHNTASEGRHEKPARGRVSPTRWLPTSSREELPTHDPGGTFETNLDTCAASISSHNINKRRHRSSPHRTTRKHRSHTTPSQPHSPCAGPSNELEDEHSGYNSGDEYIPTASSDNEEELERWFEKALKEKKGFLIKKMGEDGACLFRSVADQVYGDQEMNSIVRKHCIDYMAKNRDFFSQYVTEDFITYLNRKRHDHCHGNHLEMQAMSELFNRRVEVYQYSLEPINIFHGDGTYKENEPIRISYHRNAHYNSIIDPYKATIGVGLGLPGYQPGLAEVNLMQDAKKQSEDCHIEKAMLEDKMRETDWELTQDTIEEQVARESYLHWVQEQEKKALRQEPRSASATCSSSSDYNPLETSSSSEPPRNRSPRLRSANNSNQNSPARVELLETATALQLEGSKSPREEKKELIPADFSMSVGAVGAVGGFQETASLMNNLPPALFGLSDYDDNDILTQVIAQSQQEYLDNLKKKKSSPTHPDSYSGGEFSGAGCSSSVNNYDLAS